MEKRVKERKYHHGDLRAALIDSALSLVRERGPRGFTLNETSRRAGVAVSAPYNHFRDKEALLIAIVVLGNQTLEAELRAASSTKATDRDKLVAVYLAYIDFARKHSDLFAVMFQSGLDKRKHTEVHASAMSAFAVGLEIAVRLEHDSENGQELSMAVWTMAHGFATLAAEHAMAAFIPADSGKHGAQSLVDRLLSDSPMRRERTDKRDE